ncbi:MAG: hypothetical protein ACXITV_09700 [Luteibaculaceae bacterium]
MSLSKVIVVIITSIIALLSIIVLIRININDTKSRKLIEQNKSFFFQGTIIDLKPLSGNRNILIIVPDSVLIEPNPYLIEKSKNFYGLYSRNNNLIIFFDTGGFPDEGKSLSSIKSIEVSSVLEKIEFKSYTKTYSTRLYISLFDTEKMIKLSRNYGGNDWIKF